MSVLCVGVHACMFVCLLIRACERGAFGGRSVGVLELKLQATVCPRNKIISPQEEPNSNVSANCFVSLYL